MNQGMTNRVTSLKFSQYDPANYILDQSEGMKLSTMNRILLNLFNNDIYAFTMLVGKMKGLWWKYWFADSAVKGYAAGDMICSNGIQEVEFLSAYWKSVKTIADYGMVTNFLPHFSQQDDDSVSKYVNALTDYFHLGNRYAERQLYISLKDDNKSAVSITDAWQPYIVTTEELQRREYRLSDILEDELRQHNAKYHDSLDILDAADSSYEIDEASTSIYNKNLGEYLPKVRVQDEEHDSWVRFAAAPASNKTLGLGTEAYDFIHIVKPLGTEVHHLETWVRTDGHVSVKGYIPVAMLTELIPEEGTVEYNKWKMGGTRRFGMRLDYSINDSVSKLYFEPETDVAGLNSEDITSLVSGQVARSSAPRMIDDDTDPTEGLYKILSYNPPFSGTVLFHPKACDFPFEDLLKHTDLLKAGDDVILNDLLNADAYNHTFERARDSTHPSPVDTDIAECHLFHKKYEPLEIPENIQSPVDRAADTSNVASEIRLLRNFGVTRSPALKTVLKAAVFPDASELATPALGSNSSVLINDWTWLSGQSIVFEVPTNTQNIHFEVEGMLKEDNIDFSVYDIRILKQTETGTEETSNIRWVYDLILNYEYPKAVLKSAEAEGYEDSWRLPRLIKNMNGMMDRIEQCTLNYPLFITFMQFRLLDISQLNVLLTQLRTKADEYRTTENPLIPDDFKADAELLLKFYAYLYNYIAERLRYGALHDCLSELLSGAVTTDLNRNVLAYRLKDFLRTKQLTRPIGYYGKEYNPSKEYSVGDYCLHGGKLYKCKIKPTQGEEFNSDHWIEITTDDRGELWVLEVKDAIEQAENEVTRLVKSGSDVFANQLSSVVSRVKTLNDEYIEARNLEFRSLRNFPNLDPTKDNYKQELKKYQDKYIENFKEIYNYLEEVDRTLEDATTMKTKITSYLAFTWLDESVKQYLTYQLNRLNDSMQRYKKMNLNICRGYDKYVLKWIEVFGIKLDTSVNGLGYTVRNLLYGVAPMRSLTTIKSRLEASE